MKVDKPHKMNTFLRQNWFKIGLLIIVIAITSGAFYWFYWRPGQIRKQCWEGQQYEKESLMRVNPGDETMIGLTEQYYKDCLRKFGLEK